MPTKIKIGIVEDDYAIAQMYRMKFESEGCAVTVAENGAEGLEMILEFQPEICLVDMMMPEMDGETMLRTLRADKRGQNVKIIVLTNMGHEEMPDNVKNKLGVVSFIVKAEKTPRQVFEHVMSLIK